MAERSKALDSKSSARSMRAAGSNPALSATERKKGSGRSSVWLERVHGEHEVAGSSPVAPTILYLLAFWPFQVLQLLVFF